MLGRHTLTHDNEYFNVYDWNPLLSKNCFGRSHIFSVSNKTKDSITANNLRSTMSKFIEDSIWRNVDYAVQTGNLTDIERIYSENGLDFNAKGGGNMFTALHLAAQHEKHHVARYLIDNGADLGSEDCSGYTPLRVAACHYSLEVAQLLLQHGARANGKENGNLLLAAAKENRVELIQLLLGQGVEINGCNNAGYTALLLLLKTSVWKL